MGITKHQHHKKCSQKHLLHGRKQAVPSGLVTGDDVARDFWLLIILCRAWHRVVRRGLDICSKLFPKFQFTTLNMIYNQFLSFLSSPVRGRNQSFLHLTFVSPCTGLFSAFFASGHRKYRKERSSVDEEIAV